MFQASARHAGVLILLTLVIAAVLEAVFRISNLLNQPINPMLLAAAPSAPPYCRAGAAAKHAGTGILG